MKSIPVKHLLDNTIEFCKSSDLLYFIIDQMNALDLHNDTEIDNNLKKQIKDVLNRMTTMTLSY